MIRLTYDSFTFKEKTSVLRLCYLVDENDEEKIDENDDDYSNKQETWIFRDLTNTDK